MKRQGTDWACVAVWLSMVTLGLGFWVLLLWGLGEAMRAWAL